MKHIYLNGALALNRHKKEEYIPKCYYVYSKNEAKKSYIYQLFENKS